MAGELVGPEFVDDEYLWFCGPVGIKMAQIGDWSL
jgi:hypothetical protein